MRPNGYQHLLESKRFMKLYMYAESEDLRDIIAPVVEAMTTWLEEKGYDNITIVSEAIQECDDDDDITPADYLLGFRLELSNKNKLKEPLNFLNKVANSNKCDFVVGYFDEHTNEREDVCYFGREEGRPDLFEIANYLGL